MNGIAGMVLGTLISWLIILGLKYDETKNKLKIANKNIEILKENIATYKSQLVECRTKNEVNLRLMKKRLDLEKKVNRDENTSVSIDANRFYLK